MKVFTREEINQVLKETNTGLTIDDIDCEIARREHEVEAFEYKFETMQDKNEDDKESSDDCER